MKQIYDFVEKKVGMDKVAHLFGIAYIATITSMLFAKIDVGYISWVYAAEGALAGIVLIVGKEVFDFFNDRPFDTNDILAGATGCVAAFLSVGLLL